MTVNINNFYLTTPKACTFASVYHRKEAKNPFPDKFKEIQIAFFSHNFFMFHNISKLADIYKPSVFKHQKIQNLTCSILNPWVVSLAPEGP